MPSSTAFQVTPITGQSFGAVVTLPSDLPNNDPSKLSEEDVLKLREALLTHSVLLIPNQEHLSPASQYQLTQKLDPSLPQGSNNYGHGKEFRHKDSVLQKDGCSIPNQPQVQVLGQGTWDFAGEDKELSIGEEGHYGLTNITLTHPTHRTFHKDLLTEQEMDEGKKTRFYRWHIDSALYDLSPPLATTLLGIHVPEHDDTLTVEYTDGGDKLELTKGATCFVSGKEAFDRLSAEDKELALNTIVEYAPHPYIFISPAKATSDGLTMISEGKENPLDKLPEWETSKIKKLPMVWTNPVTGNHHLQAHGCCVYKLHRTNTGEVLELEEARKELHRVMRPAIASKNVYAHSWSKGDLVIFHNRGVWHSVTGQFKEGERRLMHQCNIASKVEPQCVKN
ncbi:hypothetical protein WICPIJ_006981 [Wickerhamomyces pijperi]|uniref:TauD/TfdA-like domain-containing protein n=1 Tax=Wickerhamomyces pijperi TaxID=599730 RepID=A0A9P8Q2H1_WICPI|nr:hypothetical protein WICPIJ_006981 [Wickerhamomyces pijperi]